MKICRLERHLHSNWHVCCKRQFCVTVCITILGNDLLAVHHDMRAQTRVSSNALYKILCDNYFSFLFSRRYKDEKKLMFPKKGVLFYNDACCWKLQDRGQTREKAILRLRDRRNGCREIIKITYELLYSYKYSLLPLLHAAYVLVYNFQLVIYIRLISCVYIKAARHWFSDIVAGILYRCCSAGHNSFFFLF